MRVGLCSLLRVPDGAWNLSPAYDLVPVQILLHCDVDELALNLNGKKRRLKADDFARYRRKTAVALLLGLMMYV